MSRPVIPDSQGNAPNFVIAGDRLIHQPTGKFVRLALSSTDADLTLALRQLKTLIGHN